jgi:hypothetical protein
MDPSGNLWGAAFDGGKTAAEFGVAFTLSPETPHWTETVLRAFDGGVAGGGPLSLTLDSSGNVFGMAEYGGTAGVGIVFEIIP